MIRFTAGDHFLLVTQDDHAHLSGRLAERLGGAVFAPLTDRAVLDGIAMHDAGWPLHDDLHGADGPTLNRDGLPLNVLEAPLELGIRVWTESARRAAAVHPYTGLLVSLHVLRLSGLFADRKPPPDADVRLDVFRLNQFQQDQIELQEKLRPALGLRIDLPRGLGLVKEGVDRREDLLRHHFDLVRFMDALSLEACSGRRLFPVHEDIRPAPYAAAIRVASAHPSPGELLLEPWPFAVPRIEESVPCRRVPNRKYESVEEFRQIYADAACAELAVRCVPA